MIKVYVQKLILEPSYLVILILVFSHKPLLGVHVVVDNIYIPKSSLIKKKRKKRKENKQCDILVETIKGHFPVMSLISSHLSCVTSSF